MNFQSNILFCILGALLTTTAIAKQCSTVAFEGTSSSMVELFAVDANPVNRVDKYTENQARKLLSGSYQYYFKPGDYSLLLRVWDRSFFKDVNLNTGSKNKNRLALKAYAENYFQTLHSKNPQYKKNEQILSDVIKEVIIDISVAEDNSYQIALNGENGQFLMSENGVELENCADQSIQVFDNYSSINKKVSDLPPALAFRVNEIMDSLDNYFDKQQLIAKNSIPAGVYQYFGAVLSNEPSSTEGYQVISVHPYSLAYKMGLVSGDRIAVLGDEKVSGNHKNSNRELSEYLAEIQPNEAIQLKVNRENQSIKLSHRFITPMIPQSSYLIGEKEHGTNSFITQNMAVPSKLSFEYDQILLELSHHYQIQLLTNNVELIGDSSVSKKYGLKGKLISYNEKSMLQVTDVAPKSTAAKLGIEVDDVIKSIHGHSIKNKSRPFALAINELKEDEQHSVVVIRDNKVITLNGAYTFHYSPAFNLKLISNTKVRELNSKLKRPRRFARFTKRDPLSNLREPIRQTHQRDMDSRASSTTSKPRNTNQSNNGGN